MREFPHKKWAIIFANIWFAIGLVALFIWLVQYFAQVVIIILFAGIIALSLHWPTNRLVTRFKLPWWLVSIIIYVIFIVIAAAILLLVGIPLATQTAAMIDQLPKIHEVVRGLLKNLDKLFSALGVKVNSKTLADSIGNSLNNFIGELLGGFARAVSFAASAIASFAAVVVLSVYFLIQAPAISRTSKGLVPVTWRKPLRDLWEEVSTLVVRYVVGNIFVSAILGVAVAIGMYFFGLPSPILLGVIAGVLDLVPVFGSILGAVPAVAFALFENVPLAIGVTIYFIVVNEVESHVLNPVVFGRALEINPVLIVLALLIGFKAAGIFGALFAVPILGIVLAIVRHAGHWYFDYSGNSKGIEL